MADEKTFIVKVPGGRSRNKELRREVERLFTDYDGNAVMLQVCRTARRLWEPEEGRPAVWTRDRYGEYWLQIELEKWKSKQTTLQGLLRSKPRGFEIAGTGWSMIVGNDAKAKRNAANLMSKAMKLRKADPAYAKRWDDHLETAKTTLNWAARWRKKKGAVAP